MAEGFISDDDVQRVRDASDIVAIVGERVPVRQRGRDLWCCCPLHNEKTPSFKIDPARQTWHCFGCGEGGDVFSFLMKVDGCTFPEAVERLAERYQVEITPRKTGGASSSKKARLKKVCAATQDFYHMQLMRSRSDDAARARSYLANRGFGGEVPKRWNLGYAPGKGMLMRHLSSLNFDVKDMVEANVVVKSRTGQMRDRFYDRVMFPVHDVQGDAIAFGGRIITDGEPKYLNSQETPIFHKSQVLFGLDMAKAALASTGEAIVVEGYTDVISMSEAGIKNVVATLGTALTTHHIRTLSQHARRRIVYLFDGDDAGMKAADRALQFIDSSITPEAGKNKIELCAVMLPDGLDPAEFIAARGADALRELIDEAVPLISYGIERRLAAYDLSSAEGRARAAAEALSVLAPIKDSLLAKDYAIQIAARCHAREQDILNQLASLPPVRRYDDYADNQADRPDMPGQTQLSTSREDVPAGAPSSPTYENISSTERNRARFEREVLSMAANYPNYAIEHADELGRVHWHDSLHTLLARSILSTLIDNPLAQTASIITHANEVDPRAAGILTADVADNVSIPPDELFRYLLEELSLGDTEEDIDNLKSKITDAESLTHDELDATFNQLVEKRRDLAQRRSEHANNDLFEAMNSNTF